MPQRIQLRRAKGWRMPENTVKVDRTTPWGNPFIVGKHGTRERCVELYRYLMGGYLCLCGNAAEQERARNYVGNNRELLRGKNLACWCPPNQPCHADILLEIVNAKNDQCAVEIAAKESK